MDHAGDSGLVRCRTVLGLTATTMKWNFHEMHCLLNQGFQTDYPVEVLARSKNLAVEITGSHWNPCEVKGPCGEIGFRRGAYRAPFEILPFVDPKMAPV